MRTQAIPTARSRRNPRGGSPASFLRLSAQPMCLVNLFTRTDIRSCHIARSDQPRVGRERGPWILLAWPAGVSAAYPSSMVNPSLQSAIEAMSLDERLELVEYIESTVDQSVIEVTEEQKATIRSRAAELQADPSIGLTWDELDARIGSRWA
jgi:putative addiction module component (TIGR02574 family)